VPSTPSSTAADDAAAAPSNIEVSVDVVEHGELQDITSRGTTSEDGKPEFVTAGVEAALSY